MIPGVLCMQAQPRCAGHLVTHVQVKGSGVGVPGHTAIVIPGVPVIALHHLDVVARVRGFHGLAIGSSHGGLELLSLLRMLGACMVGLHGIQFFLRFGVLAAIEVVLGVHQL